MSLEGPGSTAVQYARLHGLSVDHLAEPPPTPHIRALQEHIPEGLSDDTDLPHIDLPPYVNAQETLSLDKKGAELLRAANNGLSTPEELEDIIFSLLGTRQMKNLQLETPLLRTDHDSDIRSFANWENSHFKDGCLPWEPLDDEMDVGLEWPKRLKSLPAMMMKELESEKIEMHKDTLVYLQVTIKGSWTAEDERKVWDSVTLYKGNSALEPVTPPLLPLSPLMMPYIPSSPACHLPLLSDSPSLISEDLRNAEQAIFEQDSLSNPAQHGSPFTNSSNTLSSYTHIKPSDIFLPMDFFKEGEEQFPVTPHIKLDDHKVEVPLMPAMPTPSLPKTVAFNDIMGEMLLDGLSMADHSEASVLGSDEGTFFREAFGDAAANGIRNIEQEQLQQSDANDRVQVPIMDFRLPVPPWKFIRSKGSSISIVDVQKSMVANVQEQYGHPSIWPGITKLNTKLRWTVFPTDLAKVVLDESFGDDEVLNGLLDHEANKQVVDSSKLTWKPPGLRILKEDAEDDEDDQELGSFETEKIQDVTLLVKKRKMQYEEEGFNFNTSADAFPENVHARTPLADAKAMEHQIGHNLVQSRNPRNKASSSLPKDMNPLLDGPFSASNALDNFLEIRAAKKQKPTQSAYFAGPSTGGQSSNSVALNNPVQSTLPTQLYKTQQPLPAPSINPPPMPTTYIISSAILKRRLLIRAVNALVPNAIPIERDFTAHNRTTWMPNSVSRSPVTSSLDSEADFIISPSTGIILTTLQKIKQKPLPGQKAKSAFKERIEKVSARYERLVVLVSEACGDESTNGLAESDTLALAEANGVCSSLDGSVVMQFIGGSEETLAKWLVATMVQYGSHGESSIPLLEDETLWELFLRRAGMNAYAAQAVIAELKAPDGVDVEGGSKAGLFGITAFVEMEQEERIARFDGLLGGRRILERVGRVLDANWS